MIQLNYQSVAFYVATGVGLIACQSKPEASEPKRPNIIFIMSDDHAFQAISAYSDKLDSTPNIDRIARNGMRFDDACVTNSISAPSRAVILTGKHSHLNGKIDNNFPFDTSNVTFPQLFQQAGYQTAMFGKLHFGNNPKGFDQFKILPDQGCYYNPEFICKNEGKIKVHGYVTDIITDMTLKWLKKERKKDQPFMLMYLHKAPHREWFPSPRHFKEYTKRTFAEPTTLFDNYEGRGTSAKTAEMNILTHQHWCGDSKMYPDILKDLNLAAISSWDEKAFYKEYNRMDALQRSQWDSVYRPIMLDFKARYPKMTEKELMQWRYQRYMQDYMASAAAVDEGVGQILDYLESNGLLENTIVVYTSDQGFYLGEHGWFDKLFMYNESFRTPLLVQWPNVIKPGTVNTNLVQNLDFAQTFLEAAGVNAPSDMQGMSLLPLFKGETANFRDAAYYHYYEYPGIHAVKRHYGIVTKDFKLMHFYYDVDEWELYDRHKDPMEMNNVYLDPAYASIVKELKGRLTELRKQYKDSDSLSQAYIQLYKEKGKIK